MHSYILAIYVFCNFTVFKAIPIMPARCFGIWSNANYIYLAMPKIVLDTSHVY